jgi:23S rRNA (cytidine1920-2'-O)/16S rRNA (cytidine1409-2'-O)-methyltransferase
MRADQLLVAQGLAPSRSAAQRLIERGAVRWLGPAGWAVPRKAGEDLPPGCEIEVTDDAELRWVSRGGLKLDGALQVAGLSLRGRVCLDVGQSTGGFSEVMLAAGASAVVGVDVGHGQLHPHLRSDARVQCFEGLNARHLSSTQLGDACPAEGYGFITGDLSFISLTLVWPALRALLAPGGDVLMLVKPQFELQPQHIGKGGLVKDAASYALVQERLTHAVSEQGWALQSYFESPIAGGDGNREFFIHARRPHEAEAA